MAFPPPRAVLPWLLPPMAARNAFWFSLRFPAFMSACSPSTRTSAADFGPVASPPLISSPAFFCLFFSFCFCFLPAPLSKTRRPYKCPAPPNCAGDRTPSTKSCSRSSSADGQAPIVIAAQTILKNATPGLVIVLALTAGDAKIAIDDEDDKDDVDESVAVAVACASATLPDAMATMSEASDMMSRSFSADMIAVLAPPCLV